jgi:hypothetical protein
MQHVRRLYRSNEASSEWLVALSCCLLLLSGCVGFIADDGSDGEASDSASNGGPGQTGADNSGDGTTDPSDPSVGASGNSGGETNATNGGFGTSGASSGATSGSATTGDSGGALACETPGPRMLRRLTATQYRNTLADLFNDPNVPFEDVLPDAVRLGFHVDADLAVIRDLGAQQLLSFTEKVAAWAVTNKLSALTSCTTQDAACRKAFITQFGPRALRQPLSDAMIASYDKLFASEASFEQGLQTTLSAMLMSPHLLFRSELGAKTSAGDYELTPYEIASSLSYMITDSMPDDALMQAASSGALADRAEFDRQAARLLATERGKTTRRQFLEGWLEIDKLRTLVKDETQTKLSAALREKMLSEAERLFLDVFDSDNGVATLLSANYTFMDRELSDFYKVSKALSDQFQRVELGADVKRVPGIMGTGAFLASHALADATSPVKRGYAVRTRMLCQALPPPPQEVDTNLEPPPANITNRERYRAHSQDPACNGCHQLMDPVGFSFEHYDTFGRYQELDRNLPIDDSGMITGAPDGDAVLSGPQSLVDYLAQSQTVEECLAHFWSYYAYGRDEWTNKGCTTGTILEEARANGASLKSMFMALLHTPHFARRVQDK